MVKNDPVGDSAENLADAIINREIEISVNNKSVVVRKNRITGLEIKEAAISQGVGIQLDFQLLRVLPGGDQKVVGDAETIVITRLAKFVATAPDDNS